MTIFLNLLFAIIIDTFFELRSDNKNRLSDAENVCFICGIERSTFDRNGVNWREHKLHEHDRWACRLVAFGPLCCHLLASLIFLPPLLTTCDPRNTSRLGRRLPVGPLAQKAENRV